MPRRFDPTRALATPRSVLVLIGPNPRVIAYDIWAKLLWAGLNIEATDLPGNGSGPCYPIELIRAITLTWLFAGQRSAEIARLRVGCIRWQHDGIPIPGAPTADVRGNITSHRARSTIASQLYNAKEPMTLFELQEWLGHRSPASTQHYAKITPNTLARAYRDAGYFTRNVRTIEVLLDRDAVTSGAAAAGEPWQYYDLGHGYCTYTFFEQCPHRMACARCDFYTPKDASKGQLLEAKDNLQRMLANIPLTDDERAAVDDGQTALDRLL